MPIGTQTAFCLFSLKIMVLRHQKWNIIFLFVLIRGLLSCVRHCADLSTSTDYQEPIQKCFRSLEFISKFVIQSRILFSRATGGQNEDSFRIDVHLLFNSFNKMLAAAHPESILNTQVHGHTSFQRVFLYPSSIRTHDLLIVNLHLWPLDQG